jgi:hypothetical protein
MKDRKLKKAIQKLKLDEPAHALEARVMSQIEASEDLSLKPALRQMLKQHIASEPSLFFTTRVMSGIKPKRQLAALPIIPTKAWVWVFCILLIIISVAIFSSSKTSTGLGSTSFWPNSALHAISLFSQQMITYLVALSSLFLIDYFWRRRWPFSSPTE